jgi:hypothetical protein
MTHRLTLLVACGIASMAALLASCSKAAVSEREAIFAARPHLQAATHLEACARAVDRYVSNAKRWPVSDYKLAVAERPNVGSLVTFDVDHADDYKREPMIGGGKSIAVEVDCNDERIARELGYQ